MVLRKRFTAHVNSVGLLVTLITVLGIYALIVSLYARLNHWQNTTVREGVQVRASYSAILDQIVLQQRKDSVYDTLNRIITS